MKNVKNHPEHLNFFLNCEHQYTESAYIELLAPEPKSVVVHHPSVDRASIAEVEGIIKGEELFKLVFEKYARITRHSHLFSGQKIDARGVIPIWGRIMREMSYMHLYIISYTVGTPVTLFTTADAEGTKHTYGIAMDENGFPLNYAKTPCTCCAKHQVIHDNNAPYFQVPFDHSSVKGNPANPA